MSVDNTRVGNSMEERNDSLFSPKLLHEIFQHVFIRASIRDHPEGINGRYTDMRESNAAERCSPGAVIDLSVKTVDPHSPSDIDTINNRTHSKIIRRRKRFELEIALTTAISGVGKTSQVALSTNISAENCFIQSKFVLEPKPTLHLEKQIFHSDIRFVKATE